MWKDVLDEVIRKTLSGFGERLADFAPRLLAMLLILAAGAVAAWLVKVGFRFLLPRLGFDRFARRAGVSVVLQKGGIVMPASGVVALALAWSVLALFLLLAIGTLDLTIAMDLLSRAFAYLPQLLIALAILVLGAVVSGFVRRSVLIAAVNAGLPSARLLAGGAHTALVVLFAAMALEHLGVGRQVILVSFAVLFGGLVLALALAFGLAGRDLARESLERLAGRRREGAADEPDEINHL